MSQRVKGLITSSLSVFDSSNTQKLFDNPSMSVFVKKDLQNWIQLCVSSFKDIKSDLAKDVMKELEKLTLESLLPALDSVSKPISLVKSNPLMLFYLKLTDDFLFLQLALNSENAAHNG